ncbi:MAG: iron-containing alcohol dehydrogenase [Bradyrhizobium sp.]|nr:iron-containing alcohol dehydrogenase [Bradyrhizobium sp.]
MLDRFVYSGPNTRVVFGNGTIADLPAEAKRAGMTRVLILCSRGRTALAGKIAASLGEACAGICDQSVPNMPREAFDAVKAQLESSKADGFIAVGGGSPIGLAKSVAVSAQLPFIAVVTTLSGSEMSQKWALGRGLGRAAGNDLRALPTVAIYDPELVLELPPRVIAASGMNAMAHAVESLYGEDTNPVIQTLSDDAIGRLYASLPRIVADPACVDARNEALYGAWLAATFRATTCLHHTIAQQVRQLFDLDHAQTHAAVLPYALAFNGPAVPQAMKRMEKVLQTGNVPLALFAMNRTLGLPVSLLDIGMPAERLDEAADVVMKVKGANPRPYAREDVVAILQQASSGEPPKDFS